jgi:ABC-type glutathione transport system ATPase component
LSQSIEGGANKQTALDWFEKVGLAGKMHTYADFLSGGQQMRANIAITMNQNPQCVLLDEPTANLDADTTQTIIDIMVQHAKQNGTVLLWATHDMALVEKIASRVLVFDDGRLVDDCSTKNFLQNPQSDMAKTILKKRTLVKNTNIGDDVVCRLKSLSGGYKNTPIFRDITMDIYSGQVVGIHGSSGVGKTTLLRTIMGQIKPLDGTISVTDSLQAVFQNSYESINPRMTIYNCIVEGLPKHTPKQDHKNAVADVLEKVGLSSIDTSRYIDSFSGGQAVRIAIARAIISAPKLLIGDEITSALDSHIKYEILDLLLDIQRQTNMAIIFVSHDTDIIDMISHQQLKMI